MLSGAGTNYTVMGGAWSEPNRITYSFAPDGVDWDRGSNDLNARMNAQYGGDAWRDVIAEALQTWAAEANLDFTLVGDGNFDFNAQGRSQGDARFGDIRVGGHHFDRETTLARTYGPPPNGATGAGDSEINTAYTYGDGSQYDLGTVMLHELGHALGLGESPRPEASMYMYYAGVRRTLSAYDVEGIRSLYGPRVPDAYRVQGQGGSAASAIDVTSHLDANFKTYVSGLGLSSIGDTAFFSVIAPRTAGASLDVSAVATGISLLSPRVTVYDASGATIATEARADLYGNNVQVSIPDPVPGRRYIISVRGATDDVFSVGSFALAVGFSGGQVSTPAPAPTPAPVSTPTPTVAPAPTDRFESNNSFATATNLGPLGQARVGGLTIDTALDADVFSFTTAQAGAVLVASSNTLIVVADASARPVASGTGLVSFVAPSSGARYFLIIASPDGRSVANYDLSIALTPTTQVVVSAPTPIPMPTPLPTVKPTKATKAAEAKAARATRRAAQLAEAKALAMARVARKAARAPAASQAKSLGQIGR